MTRRTRRVERLVRQMAGQPGRLGQPPPQTELPRTAPRRAVAEGLSYLNNNAARMAYPHYRQQDLLITTCLAESLVEEFNARVKSRQKY